MTQLPLLSGVEIVDRPYKDARKVSKQLIRELRDSGYVKRSGQRVLVGLEKFHQRHQHWPTPKELTRFMFKHHWIPRDDSALVAPRLTELREGCKVRVKGGGYLVTGGGVCCLMALRTCAVTGESAHPVALREIGSEAKRVA